MNTKIIDILENSFSDFVVPLRMGEGFNTELFNKFLKSVKVCNEEWHNQKNIPKRLAMLLIDINPAMLSSSHYYDEQVNEKVNQGVDDATSLIRNMLS